MRAQRFKLVFLAVGFLTAPALSTSQATGAPVTITASHPYGDRRSACEDPDYSGAGWASWDWDRRQSNTRQLCPVRPNSGLQNAGHEHPGSRCQREPNVPCRLAVGVYRQSHGIPGEIEGWPSIVDAPLPSADHYHQPTTLSPSEL